MTPRSRKWTTLFSINAAIFASTFGYSSIINISPEIVRRFGFEEKDVGFLGGVIISMYFASAMLNALWGHLSDRFGRRFVLLPSMLVLGATSFGFGTSTSLWAALAWRAAAGVADSRGVLRAAVADASGKEDRVVNMSAFLFSWQAGVTVGPMVTGWLAALNLTSQPFVDRPFLLVGLPHLLVCLLAFLLVFFFLERKEEGEEEIKLLSSQVDKLDYIVEDDDDDDDKNKDDVDEKEDDNVDQKGNDDDDDENVKDAATFSKFLCCASDFSTPPLGLIIAVLANALYSFAAKGAKEALSLWGGLARSHGGAGLPTFELGLVVGLPNAAIIVVAVVAPGVIRRVGDAIAGVVGGVLAAVFTVALPGVKLAGASAAARPALLGVLFALQRGSSFLLLQALNLLINAHSPPGALGVVNGVTTSLCMLLGASGPLVIGAIVGANDAVNLGATPTFWNYGLVFMVLGAGYSVIVAGLLLLLRKSRRVIS